MLAWCGGLLVKLEGCLDNTMYQQVLEEHMHTDTAALIGHDFLSSSSTMHQPTRLDQHDNGYASMRSHCWTSHKNCLMPI